MKKISVTILICLGILVFLLPAVKAQDVPFSRGINLTNWFQVSSANEIQFTMYTKQDFEQIRSLGCDVIRLPINLHSMTKGAPDYLIDPLFYSFLDQAVNWAEELGMNLIIDNHTFDPAVNTDPSIGPVLIKVWSQMAQHYKSSSVHIFYEILNEPHGISDSDWNTIQQQVINTIRETDTTHYIVVGGAGWNSYNNLDAIPVYTDSKLIYTFHFYDPFVFTHQGASWTDPSMVPLGGVPFPYNADSMPVFPESLKGSWIESAFNDYHTTGNVASVKALLDIAVHFKNTRKVPVFCGEFGVYIPNSRNDHRAFWYETVRKYLEENGIPWTTWDYHGGFGLYKKDSNGLFDHDLNVPLLQALGLNVPEQTPWLLKPDSTGFMIYTDYIGNRIFEADYGQGTLNYYTVDRPNNGNYCIYWEGAAQYNAIGFDFMPDKDLSKLMYDGYALDMMIRGDSPLTSFDVRFIDTKTAVAGDHPWRMRITVDAGLAEFNDRWHHLFIPLSLFTEQGSWDNAWYQPEGKFDWKAVDRFEIVSEQQNLVNKKLWFDNIHVTNLDTARVFNDQVVTGLNSNLSASVRVYPNPAHDFIYITAATVNHPFYLRMMDALGQIHLQENYNSGTALDVSFIPPGLYILYIYDKQELISINKIILA
jgi:endoglucanase